MSSSLSVSQSVINVNCDYAVSAKKGVMNNRNNDRLSHCSPHMITTAQDTAGRVSFHHTIALCLKNN